MFAFLLRTGFKCLAVAALLYGTFFVSVGEYTLYEHVQRIGATEEAQQLGSAVGSAVGAAGDVVSSQLANQEFTIPD